MCHSKKVMGKRSREHLSDEPRKKRISPSGNKLPTQIPAGEILTDLTGKQWKVGKILGSGGFGEVYTASDIIKDTVKNDAPYVIKVENHSNGPLFVEINCLLRIGRLSLIDEWKENRKFQSFGMPHYVASGSCTVNKEKLRFLVMPRYEQDLEKIWLSKEKKFNLKTVILICSQIIDVLEYIHSKGYVHCDVKASNILHSCTQQQQHTSPVKQIRECYQMRSRVKKICRGHLRQIERVNYSELNTNVCIEDEQPIATVSQTTNQVILIDYGISTKYRHSNGEHKQYCNDARKAHAGTILFCSIDAHMGASSRRSDLEALGYNMIYWLTSNLPWSQDIDHPEIVQHKKESYLSNLGTFLTTCFPNQVPNFIYEYFNYVKSLSFAARPDYLYCKAIFQSALMEYGYKNDGQFDFDNLEGSGDDNNNKKQLKYVSKRLNVYKHGKRGQRVLTSNMILDKPILRKKHFKVVQKRKINWSNILIDPEHILRQYNKLNKIMEVTNKRERKLTENSDTSCGGNLLQNLDISRLNPTYAMLEVFNKSRDKNANYNGFHKHGKGDGFCTEHRKGYTPAMNMILARMYRKYENNNEIKNNYKPPLRRSQSLKTITKKIEIKKTKSSNLAKELKSTRILRGWGLRG